MTFYLNGKTCVQMFGCVTHRMGYWHRGRQIDRHLILYVFEGYVQMRVGGKTYRANAGDVLFIPAGTPYKPLDSDGCTYYVFHFDMEEAGEESPPPLPVDTLDENCEGFAYVFDEVRDTVTLDILSTPAHGKTIREIFLRAARLDVAHDAGDKRLLDIAFREFLVAMERGRHEEMQVSDTMRQIVHYILAHIREPLSLSTVASAFYLSESYVARLFKKEMGESVGTYILKQKINLACALLIDTDAGVAEVARQVGFSGPYYFSTVFSRETGMTPTAYRRRM